MATTIKVRQNGSLLVEGDDVKLIDWNGNEYKPANPQKFALCRCGHSKNKPFCDSSHKEINFQAAEAAPLPPELPAEQANLAVAPGAPENADK
jgi:CDGSH-type Zn-finger protein